MPCLECEKRSKLLREIWQAARDSDIDTYHEKLKALSESAKTDVALLMQRLTFEKLDAFFRPQGNSK